MYVNYLFKNISNVVSLSRKFHNPQCHIDRVDRAELDSRLELDKEDSKSFNGGFGGSLVNSSDNILVYKIDVLT